MIDAAIGKDLATLAIGPHPDKASYDPAQKRDDIPTAANAKLVLVSPSLAKVVGAMSTHMGARTQASDAKTGTLYLPVADYGPPTQPNGRPQPIPGAFRVLKVTLRWPGRGPIEPGNPGMTTAE